MTPPHPTSGRTPWLPGAALVLLGLGVLGLRASSEGEGSLAGAPGDPGDPGAADGDGILWLGDGGTIDFEPAATLGGDGRLWVAWLAWDEADSSVDLVAACLEEGAVVGSGVLAEHLELPAAPTIAAFEDGVYAVWEAGAEGARTLDGLAASRDGSEVAAGPRERVVEPGFGRLVPRLSAGPDDALDLVWQELVGTSYDVLHAARGEDGWSAPHAIADTHDDEWNPRCARGPDGALHVVYDRWIKDSFDVHYARLEGGKLVAGRAVTITAPHQAWPDVSVAPNGDVWIAWESDPAFGEGSALRGPDVAFRLARLRGDELLAVPADDLDQGRKRRDFPRLVATDDGPLLVYRALGSAPPPGTKARETYSYWRTGALTFGEDGLPLDHLVEDSDGDNDPQEQLVVAADGRLWCVFSGDRRSRGFAEIKRWGGSLEGRSRIGVVGLERPGHAPRLEAFPPPGSENSRRRRSTAWWNEVPREIDGETLLFGDLHRHTHLSRCAGARDGTALDAYRYARGPGNLDFVAITDHYQHLTPFSWWRSLRDVRRYHAPGSLVTFAALERMLGPKGHFNAIYPGVARGAADLEPGDGLGRTPEDADGGDPILIPHMMGIEPNGFDWDTFDAEHHRVLEVYQGSRGSYEGPGLPYEASDLWREEGSIATGLERGHHFGLIASSDHNSSNVSFAGLWVRRPDRAGVFEALRERRAFAGTAQRYVDARLGDLPMGASGAVAAGTPFELRLWPSRRPSYPGPPHSVEILKNGRTIERFVGSSRLELFMISTRHGAEGRPLRIRAQGGFVRGGEPRAGTVEAVTRRYEDEWLTVTRSGWERLDYLFHVEWYPDATERALVVSHGDERVRIPMAELPVGRSTRVVYAPDASPRSVKRNSESLWRVGAAFEPPRRPPDQEPDLAGPWPERPGSEFDFTDPDVTAGDSYYARIVWRDGEISWTSPIRVTEVLP